MDTARVLFVVSAVLFVLAAIDAQGTDVLGIHAEAFALLGLACWAGSGAL